MALGFPSWLITGAAGLIHVILSLAVLAVGFPLLLTAFPGLPAWPFGTGTRFLLLTSLANFLILRTAFWRSFVVIYLSSTPPKDRQLTRARILAFQQCRAVAIGLNTAWPLFLDLAPPGTLEHWTGRLFAVTVGLWAAVNVVRVLRAYDRIASVMDYGLVPLCVSIAMLVKPQLPSQYPAVPSYVLLEAMFGIVMIHWGFLLYACFTRKLVTAATARKWIGKVHLLLMVLHVINIWIYQWWAVLPIMLWPKALFLVVFPALKVKELLTKKQK